MITHGNDIKIFTANSNSKLAQDIVAELTKKLTEAKKKAEGAGIHFGEISLGKSEVGKFSDGEIYVNINETVRGSDVFVVQSTCDPVNDNLMELLIMIDAFKRASAGRITAVIPYYGYARQDRKAKARDPISAKLVADLIETAGADRVLTMDLHAAQIQGFFNIPVDHLLGFAKLAPYYVNKFADQMEDVVVVSPDFGSVTRARKFAQRLNVPIAIVDKRRPRPNVAEVMNIIGDIKDKTIILVDDMIDTAGTITNGAQALMDRGAKGIYACCTHPVLSGPALERIEKSPIKELLVLDTIALTPDKMSDKIHVLSVADIFAEAIWRIYADISVSPMFA
ncbi:MAG: ribose-phosphate pyrophosphokinase [Clostridia bacterium]|nr:ribose-phosphate pyrophosphokinase [Oscillospiraceae bacterium]MBQ7033851.1 ribose-phosphate pyrophosphokinase [Clostridia bacterium]